MEMKSFPTINLKATGKRIEQLRKEQGLSVKDMQNYFGFDAPQAIYKWQSGTTLPSVDNLVGLSALLGVPMEDILVTVQQDNRRRTDNEPAGSVFFCLFSCAGRGRAYKNGCPDRTAVGKLRRMWTRGVMARDGSEKVDPTGAHGVTPWERKIDRTRSRGAGP